MLFAAFLLAVAAAEPEAVWPSTYGSPLGYGLQQPWGLRQGAWGLPHQLPYGRVINPWINNNFQHQRILGLGAGRIFKREADSFWGTPYNMGMMGGHMGWAGAAAYSPLAYSGLQMPYAAPQIQQQVVDEVDEDHSALTPASTTKMVYNFPHLQKHVLYASSGLHHPALRRFVREAEADSESFYPFYNQGLNAFNGHRGFLPYSAAAGLPWARHPAALPAFHHQQRGLPYAGINNGLFGRRFF